MTLDPKKKKKKNPHPTHKADMQDFWQLIIIIIKSILKYGTNY